MPIESGFQRNADRTLKLKNRSGHIASQIGGVGISTINEIFYDNAATSAATLYRLKDWLFTTDGAICVTQTDPGNTRTHNGIKVSAIGEMFISVAAPGTGSYVVYDQIFGYLMVSSAGGVHVTLPTIAVLNSAGTSYPASLVVLNSAGTPFTVTHAVLNSAGTSFTVI